MRRLLRRLLPTSDREGREGDSREPRLLPLIPPDRPLPYSWVLTNRLALGPMPGGEAHWQQLEQAGLRARFSCCYPHEEGPSPVPSHWLSAGVPLPDHRRQEPLDEARLTEALDRAQLLLNQGEPLYLHCLAGIERSPLIAVGLTARERNLSLFDALDWVRRCHPVAMPLVNHLELLDRLLAEDAA
jgi:hypothetical protein